MSGDTPLLIVAGSNRRHSLNRKVAANALLMSRALQLNATLIDLREHPLPLYDGDLELLPDAATALPALRQEFMRHPLWLIASPDYNSSVSPLLKNLIDWISRPVSGHHYMTCFQNKMIGLMSSSPGTSGGSRGLPHLRQILMHLGAHVHEQVFLVPRGADAFDDQDQLRDAQKREELRGFIAQLTQGMQETNRSVA
jgi:NAD(P)H-dependent FMN reductase